MRRGGLWRGGRCLGGRGKGFFVGNELGLFFFFFLRGGVVVIRTFLFFPSFPFFLCTLSILPSFFLSFFFLM